MRYKQYAVRENIYMIGIRKAYVMNDCDWMLEIGRDANVIS